MIWWRRWVLSTIGDSWCSSHFIWEVVGERWLSREIKDAACTGLVMISVLINPQRDTVDWVILRMFKFVPKVFTISLPCVCVCPQAALVPIDPLAVASKPIGRVDCAVLRSVQVRSWSTVLTIALACEETPAILVPIDSLAIVSKPLTGARQRKLFTGSAPFWGTFKSDSKVSWTTLALGCVEKTWMEGARSLFLDNILARRKESKPLSPENIQVRP